MKTKAYVIISALIFTVVALVHLIRLVQGWPVQVGSLGIPLACSVLALLASGGVAIWGFTLLRRKV